MRLFLITLGSALLTSAAIANAFLQKRQFYPAVVYITKSNPSMAVCIIVYLQNEVNYLQLRSILQAPTEDLPHTFSSITKEEQ